MIFGLKVKSECPLPFPAGRNREDGTGGASVELRDVAGLAERVDEDRLGRLSEDGVALQYGGWLFSLQPATGRIDYARHETGPLELPLEHVLERMILPLYATISNPTYSCVHASAAVLDGRAWLFIGDTGAGKSTTVYELTRRGDAKLAADEMAVVDVEELLLYPGAPALRLDTSRAIPEAIDQGAIHPDVEKRWYRFPSDRIATEPAPIAGIVLLEPRGSLEAEVSGSQARAVRRLSGGERLTRLLAETFDFEAKPESWSRRRFSNAAALAKSVPVFLFRYERSASGQPDHIPALEALIADMAWE